jgi:hypothetical protein
MHIYKFFLANNINFECSDISVKEIYVNLKSITLRANKLIDKLERKVTKVTRADMGFFFNIEFPEKFVTKNKSINKTFSKCKKNSRWQISHLKNTSTFWICYSFIEKYYFKTKAITLIKSLLRNGIIIQDVDGREWDDPEGSFEDYSENNEDL